MTKFIFILSFYFHVCFSQCQKAFITEVLADPLITPDSESEFVEIYLPDQSQNCVYFLYLDNEIIFQSRGRDKADFIITQGKTRTLPNSKELYLSLNYIHSFDILETVQQGDSLLSIPKDTLQADGTIVPQAQAGESWERNFTQGQPSNWILNTLHKATPRESNPNIQKEFLNCSWEEGFVSCNKSSRISIHTYLSDDFNRWVLMDSIDFDTDQRNFKPLSSSPTASYVKRTIQGDLFKKDNNKYSWHIAPAVFNTLHIRANKDEPEWIQLSLQESMDSLVITRGNKKYLLHPLGQGECILTSDSLAWRSHFGDLRICLSQLTPFPMLANSGDTLYLSSQDAVLDTIFWEAQDSIYHVEGPPQIRPFHIQLMTATLFSPDDLQFNFMQNMTIDSVHLHLGSLKQGNIVSRQLHYLELESFIRTTISNVQDIHFALTIETNHGNRNYTFHKLYDIE